MGRDLPLGRNAAFAEVKVDALSSEDMGRLMGVPFVFVDKIITIDPVTMGEKVIYVRGEQ